MKTILFGRKHGNENFELIAGPEVSASSQLELRASFMEGLPVNKTWAEVRIWGENDIKGKLQFLTADQSKLADESKKKIENEAENIRAISKKRQSERDKAEKDEAAKRHAAEVAELNKKHADFVAPHLKKEGK